MKRKLLLLLLMLGFCALPVLAADPVSPWTHGDNEVLLQGSYAKSADTNEWSGDIEAGWLRFVSENQEVGTVFSLVKTEAGEEGFSFGPIYEWNLVNLNKGHFFLGGDAQVLMSDLADLASLSTTGRVGYKLHIGKSSAIRLSFDYDKAVNEENDEMGDRINGFGFNVGVSIGFNKGTDIS